MAELSMAGMKPERLRIVGIRNGAVVEWAGREAGEADSRAEAARVAVLTESVSVPDAA
jgi:hypothetical protein